MLRLNPEKADVLKFASVPKKPGELETIQVTPNSSAETKTYYVGVRAVDDNQNIGEMSNILSISVITDPKWIPPKEKGPSQMLIVIILGVVALLVVALVITCIVCMCRRKSPGSKLPVSYDNRAYTDTESKY